MSSDFLAMYLCNERMAKGSTDPLMPLVRYLKGEKPITHEMRNWLAELLDRNSDSEFRIDKKRRRKGAPGGRKKAGDFVFERAVELSNQLVTKKFIDELVEATGWLMAPDQNAEPSVFRLGPKDRDQYGYGYVNHRVSLRVGRKLTKRQIEEIIAAESGYNFPPQKAVGLRSVQRYLREWER